MRCKYCQEEIGQDNVVKSKSGKKEMSFCSWRHLHKYLVDVFTTGRQIEEGLEAGKPTK